MGMKVAAGTINRQGRGVPKAISVPRGVKPLGTREYEAVVENNGKPMAIVEEDTTISLVNAEFERLSGYTREEIEGKKRWTEFVARGDRKRMREYHRLSKLDPLLAPQCIEFLFVDRHGKVQNIALTIGQMPGINKGTAFLLDITDHRQAEKTVQKNNKSLERHIESQTTALVKANELLQAKVTDLKREVARLRLREERYRTLVDNIDVGINLIDRDHNILMVNARQGIAFKKPVNEIIGKKCFREFEKRDAVCPHCPGVRAMATGQPAEAEAKGIRDDSSRFDVRIQAFPISGQDGAVMGFIEISEDITERKRSEEALRQSEEKYRTIIENIQESYFENDLAGNFTFVNDTLCRNIRYTREELLGMNFRQYTDETTAERMYQLYSAVYRTGEPIKILDEEIIRKDGTIVVNELSVSLIRDAEGKPIGFRGIARDITERRWAEEVLRRSEEKYRTILENITEGYFENDLRGNFIFLNDSLLEIYGYTRDELLHMNYRQYMDEENAQKVYQAYNKVYTTGKPEREIQYEITRKDGIRRYCENSVSLIRDAARKPVGFRGVARDITERQQAEEALRQSEEKYRTILDNMLDGYTEVDLSGKITFTNKSAFKILGWTEEEFSGMNYKNYTSPEKTKKIFEIYNKVYRTGEPATLVEYEVITKDGKPLIIEGTVTLMRDKSGKPIGFRCLSRDITKRRQAEEALRQSEEKYRTIIESIEDAYSENDLRGNFTFFNDSLCRMLGYTKDELTHMNYRDYMDEENAQKVFQIYNRVYTTGEPEKEFQYEIIAKDGTRKYADISISLIKDAGGQPVGFRGIARDRTERKRAEERLQSYAIELERSNEEVKNFAYIVSHDLRVPLVNLKGYTNELRTALGAIGANFDAALPHLNDEKRSEVAMALHEDVPEALEFIANSVSRMDSFINAILILSRLGRQDLKPEPVDMNALVQAALESMSHQIKEQGIEVHVGSLPQVAADRTAMERIIGNILSNAVKYVDSERPCRIEVAAETNNSETIFSIQDTGRGIVQEDMHKVFAPFRRAGKQDTQGEGMGLAYVQTLVRRHGGRIWCESEPGKGTLFTFTIATSSEKGAHDA